MAGGRAGRPLGLKQEVARDCGSGSGWRLPCRSSSDDPFYRRRHIERRWQHGSTASATPECTPDYLCFQMWVSHREEEENHGNKFSSRNITMGGFGDTNVHKRGHHLFADLRVGWPELSDTPNANRFILRIK
ncbi:uncharacterized protein LOC124705740 [Lolium rigidum]|nr:uncharacterized protein LOC124705740 [Lolium rigidum]